MQDYELYYLRHTQYSAISSDYDAAIAMASVLELSPDSIRGRLSRANTSANQARLLKEIATIEPDIAPAVKRQMVVLEQSMRFWNNWTRSEGDMTAVFLSDIHLPHPRWDAYQLAMQITDAINPQFVSGANDLRDNTGYGRWGDDRPLRGQIMSSDDSNILNLELTHYRTISKGRLVIQVMGNHDLWYYRNLRETSPKTAEGKIADYMEKLLESGLVQFSRGYNENYIQLGEGLIWWHGQFTNKSSLALAKNNIEHFLHQFNDGRVRSVVAGHTHRPLVVSGSSVGYPSVSYVNSGALTEYAPYLKRHPHGHGLGIVVCKFRFGDWQHQVDLLQFVTKGNALTCRYEGVNYSVPLDTSNKEEYL